MATIRENNGDAKQGPETQYTIALGDVFQGTLDPDDRADFIRVELTADGTIYKFILTGDGFGDTNLISFTLWDSVEAGPRHYDGHAYNGGKELIFSPTVSGTYLIDVHSFDSNYSGDYELSLVENTTPEGTYDEIADYLTDGFWESRGGARQAFDVGPGGVLTANITALTEEGQQLARWALEAWTNVTGIEFQFVDDDGAHIVFDDLPHLPPFGGPSIVNGSVITASSVNVPTRLHGNGVSPDLGTTIDILAFYIYLHEIGHALGLGHSGPYGYGSSVGLRYSKPQIFLNDSHQASAMSYRGQGYIINASNADPVTPMIADIIAIQNLYGVPTDINAGDTVYGYQSNVDGFLGEFFKLWVGDENSSPQTLSRPTTLTLYDNGGNDTLDLRTDTTDQRVFLRPEGISDVYGLTGNLVIARDTIIENVVAGYGDDIVGGNAAANHLQGRDGNDGLWGSSGDDVLEGGRGNDRLNGGPGADTFVFSPGHGNDIITDFESGTDRIDLTDIVRLRSIDDVGITRNESDTLIDLSGYQGGTIKLAGFTGTLTASDFRLPVLIEGTPADDTLTGGPGNEVFEGGAGADTLDGGPGMDTASYRGSDTGVTVKLREGAGERGHAQGDTLIDIEHLIGSGHGDILGGDNGNNQLDGGDGNDGLWSSGGDDVLLGGAGDDRLYASIGNDRLEGGSGNDVLAGGAGADRLDGGAGADRLDGGEGIDWIGYQSSDAGVTVNLRDGTGEGGHAEGDVIADVENIIGSDHGDTLSGDDGVNHLVGGGGNDVLSGGAGVDRLDGGAGVDWVSYQDSDAGVRDSGVFVDLEDGTGTTIQELDDYITDVITNVENITGTNYRDELTGDNGANTLQGLDGDDELIGRAGADRLDGSAGTDRLWGGEGADVFIFAPGHGDDTIYYFSDNEDKVDLSAFDLAGFDDLTLSSTSGDVTIDLTEHGGGTILLQNFDIADLDATDFIF